MRSFGEPIDVRGYQVPSSFTDQTVYIHVHPSGGDQISDRDGAGESVARRLQGHGEVKINTSNRDTGQKGDMLYYDDHWYECVSCEKWDHTILNHYNYIFTLVPEHAEGNKEEFTEPDNIGGGF